jgi:hypothetical protein
MRKLLFLGTVALALTSCMGMPLVLTVSSDRAARSDRPASADRPAPQAPQNSFLLGEQEVDFKADRDTINVRDHEGAFRSLYFIVEKNDLELFNLVILFANGQKQEFGTRLLFNEGSRSRLLDLEGRERRIKSIQFFYRTVGAKWEGKARVIVYGVR